MHSSLHLEACEDILYLILQIALLLLSCYYSIAQHGWYKIKTREQNNAVCLGLFNIPQIEGEFDGKGGKTN